jgi:hypothetical protein
MIVAIIFVCLSAYFTKTNGDRYVSRLWQWQSLIKNGQFDAATKLESQLNPADLVTYKTLYDPNFLKKQLNTLVALPNKTIDDLLEITRINLILGKKDEARQTINQAYELDPIRDDVSKLYYEISK